MVKPLVSGITADAYDCIMVRIRIGSTEYKCVARGSAPDGELPSDHQASGISGLLARHSDVKGAAKHKRR
jgi:hypothetical protein